MAAGDRATALAEAAQALTALTGALAARAEFTVHGTSWLVDDDNPQWPQVQADAIRSAVTKARDYAAALGGTVATVEHIADAGLLGSGEPVRFDWMGQAQAASRSRGGDATPLLDPVPCELTATIDARFAATGISLD